ncbi:MAG TPA: Ig-like domain-containing protein [Pyrinomonadaceae bacterium]|nr:Ig-like domain-containing protein [Pyrinomonadaceae bacterium]
MHQAAPTPTRTRSLFRQATFRHVLVLFLCYCLVLQTNAAFANPVGLNPFTPSAPANNAGLPGNSASRSWSLLDHAFSFFESTEAEPPMVVAPVDAAISRKVPTLSNGRVEGNLRVYTGQDFSFEGGFVVTNETYVVGTPNVTVATNATFNAGTVDESGSPDPVGYTVAINGTSRLIGKIHRRSDPLAFPADIPTSVPQPTGTRIVNINTSADLANIGDWSTLKELHVNKSNETINVPAGNYGAFSVTGSSKLNFTGGVYNFVDGFSFASNATIKVTGQTTINVASSATLSNTGLLFGENTLPGDIKLNVLGSTLTINGNSTIKAIVRVPNGTATLTGSCQVRGQVIADKLEILTNAQVIGDTSTNATGDTTPPNVIITSPANNATINDSSVTVTGTAVDPGVGASGVSSVLVNNIAATYNPNTNAWSANVALNFGPNPITVRATDGAGNTSPDQQIIVNRPQDTTPPTVAITSPANNSTTESSSITVSGTVSDTGTSATGVAQVTVNGSPATLNLQDGTWTIANVSLNTGPNEITAVATDNANNASQPTTITINRQNPQDTTAPTLSITSPLDNSETPNASVTVTATAADTGANATGVSRVVVNGQTASFNAQTQEWTVNISLTEGSNTINAYAEDNASPANRSTTATINVIRCTPDTTPPTVTITSPVTSLSTYDSTVNLAGTAQDTGLNATGVQSVTVNGTPATYNPVTHQWSVASFALTFGVNHIVVTAIDGASPANQAQATVDITRLQLQPPTLTITNPLNGAVVSSSSITVAGSVSSDLPNGLSLTINGTSTPITGGQFARTVQLNDGSNTISVVATDGQAQQSQSSITVIRDVTAPAISFVNVPASVQPGGTYQILINATDNVGIADVELRLNGQRIETVTTAPYQFTLSVPAVFASGVTLVLSAVARDLTNTTTVATAQLQTAGPGGISGYVFDDTTGYVMQGVNALLNGSSPVTTDEAGVFSFVSTTPAGVVRLSKDGYTPVERLYKVAIGEGTALFDARLTPLDSQTNTIGASGGTINGDGGRVQVSFVAGALSQQTDLRVTSVSPQGLANLLPYGWSPVPGAIVDIRTAEGSAAMQSPAHLTISQVAGLSSATPLTLVRYDETTHSWAVVAVELHAAAGGALSADLPSLGQYAFLVADTGATAPPTPVLGQPLPSSQSADSAALDSAQATAESLPRTAAFSPTAKSSISFLATAASQLPSGVSIEASFGETYNLLGGRDPVFVDRPAQDFVLYAFPAATGQPNRLGAFFIAKPTRTNFSITDLFNANVHVEIRSGRQNKLGALVDNQGGSVRAGDGSQLLIPANAVSGSQSVFFENVSLQSTGVSLPAGYELLAAFDVDLGSASLNSSASITVPGLTGDLSRVVVAQLITVGGQRSPKVVARAIAEANDKLTSTTAIPPLPAGVALRGIRATGRYLFIRVPSAFGYVKGTITDAATSAPQTMVRVSTNQTPFVDVTATDGQYVLIGAAGPAPTGVNQIGAAALATDATGTATASLEGQDDVANSNVALSAVALQVESITPASGAQSMIATTPVTVTFNKPVAAQTLTGSSFTLSTNAGNPVLGSITVLAGSRVVVFTPAATLAASTTYKVSLSTAVRDIYGHALSAVFNSTFTTAATVVISNRLKPEQIRIGYPDGNELSTISIPANSVPNGSSILVVNTTSGSTLSTVAGTSALSLQIQARVGDEISLTITQPDGTQYAVTQAAYRRADGFISVGSNGGTLTSDNGQVLLSIPAGAISGQADLKLTTRAESDITIPRTGEMDPTEVPWGAGVRIQASGNFTNSKELHLEIAAPPTATEGQRVAFMKPAKITEGNVERDVWEILTSGKVEGGKFKTMSPPFIGVTIVSTLGFFDVDVFVPRRFRAVTGTVTELVPNAAPKPLPNVVCTIKNPGTNAQVVARTAANGRFGTLDFAASSGTTAEVEARDTIDRTKTVTATPYLSVDPSETGLHGLQTLFAAIQFPSSAGLPETLPALLRLEGRMLDLPDGQPDTLQSVGRVVLGSHLEIKVTTTPNVQQISGQLLVGGNTTQQLTWTRQSSEAGTGVFTTDFTVTGEGSYSVVVTTFTQANVLPTRATSTFGFVALQNPNNRPSLEGPPRVMGVTPNSGAQQVGTGTRIHLDFNEPVKNLIPGTNVFLTDLATQQRITGEITSGGLPVTPTSPNISSIDFEPANGLEANKEYAVEVLTTVTDSDGHALDQNYTSATDTDPQPFLSTFKTFRPLVIGTNASQTVSYRLETASDLGITVAPSTLGSQLNVYDLSDPQKPVVTGTKFVPFFATAYDIAEAEQDSDIITVHTPVRRAYEVIAVVLAYSVQDLERPINAFIYSLDDPTTPELIGVSSLKIPKSAPSYPMYVRIHHKRAYIGNGGRDSLEVVDLEEAVRTLAETNDPKTAWFPAVLPGLNAGFDREAKKQMASYRRTPTEGAPIYSLSVMDQAVPASNGSPVQSPVVYIASNRLQLLSFDTNSSWDGSFALVDANGDSLDDRLIGTRDLDPAGFAVDVRTAPARMVNGQSTDIAALLGSDRLWLFNVTNPRAPQPYPSRSFAEMGLGGHVARRMDLEDTLLYVMFADRVAVIDFSDPSNLVVRGVITDLGSDLRWISVHDGFVYTLDLANGKSNVRTSIGSAAATVFVHGADGSTCMNPVLINRTDDRMIQPAETVFKVYGLDVPQSGKVIIRKQTRTGDQVISTVLAEVPAVFDPSSTPDVLMGRATWTSSEQIDRAATYTAELVVNGQSSEFRARAVPIVFSHLLDEYQQIIGVSGRRGGGKLAYLLGANAHVTLRVNGSLVNLGEPPSTFRTFGLHVEDIKMGNLPNLAPGNYQFKLTATLENGSVTEEADGTIVVENDSANQRQPGNIFVNNVEIETGNLALTESDIPEIRNRGLSLSFTRLYNSRGSNTYNTLGYGWTHNYQVLLRRSPDPNNPAESIYTLEGAEGNSQVFRGTELKSDPPFHTKLQKNSDNSFDFFTKGNIRYHFNQALEVGSEQMFNLGYMGNLAFMEEPNGNKLTFGYDSQGRLATVTDSSNRKLTFTYEQGATPFVGTLDTGSTTNQSLTCTNKRFLNSLRRKFELGQLGVAWRITRITGPGGLEVLYDYDAKGNLTRIERTGADGISQPAAPNVTVYAYDPSNGASASTEHLLKSVQTPNHGTQSHVTTYEYESTNFGMMVKAIRMPEAVNNLYAYTFSATEVTETAFTDGRGNVTRYQFTNNRPGKTVTVNAPRNAVSTITFDKDGNSLSETDPEGRQTTTQYDDRGNQVLQTVSGQGTTITTKATFDPKFAKPLSTTDGNGNPITYSLDGRGNVTRVHLPTGRDIQMDYAGNGDLSRVVDQYGFATNYQYDTFGNPTTITRQTSGQGIVVTNNTYDARSRLLTSSDTIAPSVQNTYDRFDRIVSQTVTDPAGFRDQLTTTFLYLPEGQVKKVTRNGGAQTLVVDNTYDGLNRLVQSEETPNGAGPFVLTYTYDGNSNVLTNTDRRGVTTTRTYDELNFVRSETLSGPFGAQITVSRLTEVDRIGNPVRLTNQYEQETTFEYDGLRRLTKRHLPGDLTEETGYDANSNIVLQIDRNGGRSTFAYDEINRRTRMTDPAGRVTSWVFDDASRSVTQQNDPQGLTETVTVDGIGRPLVRDIKFTGASQRTSNSYSGRSVQTTDPRGIVSVSQLSAFGETGSLTVNGANPAFNIQRSYAAFGGLKRAVDANGRVTTYTLDGLNRATLISHTGGFSESLTYDGAGNVVSHSDMRGVVSQMTYDNQGRSLVTTVQDESQQIAVQTIAYEDALSKETRTDAKGNATTLVYDGLRRLKSVRNADSKTRTLEYDGINLRQESDFKGANTFFLYDPVNRVKQITDRLGQVTTISNSDSGGYRKAITDRRGNQRIEIYDPLRRIVSVTQGGQPLASYEYDENNNRRALIDGLNNRTEYTYDNLNRVTQVTHAGNLQTETFTYDAVGNVLTYSDGAGAPVVQTYDELNHLKTRTDGAGNVTKFQYDGGGLLLERTDPKGAQYKTTYSYNALGSLKQITDAKSGVWEFDYDPAQNLIGIKDALNRSVSYDYDSLNRLKTVTQPQQHVTTYGYDANSNRNAITDPQNHVANISYDALDRIQSVNYIQPTGSGPRSYNYGYDPEGNLTSVDETTLLDTLKTRRYTRTYDRRNRITSATDPFNHKVKFDYDAANNVTSLTDAADNSIGYSYDALNRLQTATLENQSATINYQWQADGLLKQVSYPSGMRRDYTYDAADRLTKVTNLINSTESEEFAYTYDANTNRATETRNQNGRINRSITYDYDLLDRLTSANYTTLGQRPANPAPGQSVSYTEATRLNEFGYDAVGNRGTSTAQDRTTTITLTTDNNGVTSESRQNSDSALVTTTALFNELNRLTQLSSNAAGSVATTYDYDRNGNLTSTRQNTQITTKYEYDCRDQLRRVLNGSNQEVAAYDYNFDRQRIAKTIGGVPLTYVYAGDQVVSEYGLNDQLVNRYDVSAGEVVRAQLGGEGERYYFSDGQGSVTSLAQASAVTARYEYDAWGQYFASSGASYNSIGYTGQRFDNETGLMPLGNGERYYSPFTGNFIQQDSFTGMAMMAQSMNRYAYAMNNPLKFMDRSGNNPDPIQQWFRDARKALEYWASHGPTSSTKEWAHTILHAQLSGAQLTYSVGKGVYNFGSELVKTAADAITFQGNAIQGMHFKDMKFSSNLAQGLQKDLVAGNYGKAATDLVWGLTIVGPPIENVTNTLLDYNEGKISIDEVNERMGEQIGGLAGSLILAGAIKKSTTQVATESTTQISTKLKPATTSAVATEAAAVDVAAEVSTRSAGTRAASVTRAAAATEEFVGPRIGRSGFRTSQEFADAAFKRYQELVDRGYSAAQKAQSRGKLTTGAENTRIGSFVDRYSRARFRNWLASEGIPEGPNKIIQVNRRLYDPSGSGTYVQPDVRIPSAQAIFDASVEMKWATTPQVMKFRNFSGGDRVTITRPQQLGGSYSIWP